MKPRIIALYRGEEYIDTGTIHKLAIKHGLKYATLSWLASPSGQKRKLGKKGWNVVVLEDDEE